MKVRLFTKEAVILLLVAMLTMTFIISPVLANIDFVDGTENHLSIQNTGKDVLSGPTKIGLNSTVGDESNLDSTDEWSGFISDDGCSAQLVIGLNNGRLNAYARLIGIIAKHDCEVVNTVSVTEQIIAVVVNVSLTETSSFVKEMRADGLLRYIEPRMKFQVQTVPNDPYWSLQWGPQKIEADYAWNTTTGNASVLVAVIDTGIDYDHPDLAANYVALGYDWVNRDTDPMDDFGHGTHCAGIIAAVLNNTVGIAGIANVSIMAEKGLDAYGSGVEDDLANAIIHAVDQGADILSNSWGGYGESLLIHDAVRYAYNHSVLVIAAAGNEALSDKLIPAAYDEVVAVTATDSYDNPASFTNFGDWVEVAAPGVDIYSTMPTYHVTMNDPPYSKNLNYDYLNGTSMACPHVAGVTALIWSRFTNATRDWVKAQLRYTSDDLGDPGFDEYYGYGRINVRKAVEQVPQDHDLLIFNWEKPAYIQPGDITSLNVTILNFGANDEQNVTVQLLVDGNLTYSTQISHLASGTLTTVSLSWNPQVEQMYNVTFCVVPVPGENATENNVLVEIISVRSFVGFVLFDQTRCDLIKWYSIWVSNLMDTGYAVDICTADAITPDTLADYDIFVIPQAWNDYSSDEISVIQDFVLNGGGLLVIGDSSPWIYSNLTSFAGITWSDYYDWWGYTSDITPHDVTEGVTSAYFSNPTSQLFISSPAIDLIRDGYGNNSTMLAVSEVGAGRVIGIADEDTITDYAVSYANNLRLANNMIDWLLGFKYEHELVVRLDTPSYLEPGNMSLLNATVYNRGLKNETDVQLRLLTNGTIVGNITIPKLVNGTKYIMNYMWTPSVEAVYNVTAYAPPVPSENVTVNNLETEFVSVRYPLINPVEGQYANYIDNSYDSSGCLIQTAYWNFTYDHYVEPYKIYTTLWLKSPSGNASTYWMTVNTMNRFVEIGSVWARSWYAGWIETNINIGSTTKLLYGIAKVNGTRMVVVGPQAVDCWEISYSEQGQQLTYWYDKRSGLWIGMEYMGKENRHKLLLVDTNVPIGTQYEHDLGVSLDAPRFLGAGETSLLSPTAYNLGLSNETNVRLQLFINGTQVANKTLAKLVNGTSYILNYSWTPTTQGIYSITARVPPVLGENVTANNICSAFVTVRAAPMLPVANFTWTPPTPKVGESITFDASASTPDGGTIVKYKWNFGDGGTATGKIVTHIYVNPGTYPVTLNVTDSEGLWDIEQRQIHVVQHYGPKAEFTWTPLTPRTDETIKFDASTSLPGWNGTHTMPITEYHWDFGDGNTTTISTPLIHHSYKTTGNYYVNLTVYALGATPETNSTTHKVTVTMPPLMVSISPTSAEIKVGESVTFSSTVSGGEMPYSYQWYLDGVEVSGATLNTWTFTSTLSGIYYIHLKVTDSNNNIVQSDTARITVSAVPVGGYSFPIDTHTTVKPLTPYTVLIAILTVASAMIRRKTSIKPK